MRIFTAITLLIALGSAFVCIKKDLDEITAKIGRIEAKLSESPSIEDAEWETVQNARRSVVRIIGGESEGSGFAIKEGGFIITNYHVIQFEPSPKVILPDNTFQIGNVIMVDRAADLAVIKIAKNLEPISLADSDALKLTDDLIAVGFPLGGAIMGDASLCKGVFSGKRTLDGADVEYIQTDMTFVEGMSGGPMINSDGEAVGIVTSGVYSGGIGFAVSADTMRDRWIEINSFEDYAHDIQRFQFRPNESPLEAVRAFYNYLKIRKLEKAFELLSQNFVQGYSFEHWQRGYQPLLDTTVISIYRDFVIKNRIKIKLATKDLVGEEIIYKYFEGYWDVRKIDGKWLLWDPEIRQVFEPDNDWFDPRVDLMKEIDAFADTHERFNELSPTIMKLREDSANNSLTMQELYDLAIEFQGHIT